MVFHARGCADAQGAVQRAAMRNARAQCACVGVHAEAAWPAGLPRLCAADGMACEPRVETTIPAHHPPSTRRTQPFGQRVATCYVCMPARGHVQAARDVQAAWPPRSCICAHGRLSPLGHGGRRGPAGGGLWRAAWSARWLGRRSRCRSTQAPICRGYMTGLALSRSAQLGSEC